VHVGVQAMTFCRRISLEEIERKPLKLRLCRMCCDIRLFPTTHTVEVLGPLSMILLLANAVLIVINNALEVVTQNPLPINCHLLSDNQ